MENWVMGCVPGGRSVRMVSTCAGIFLPLSASSADSASTCSLLGICKPFKEDDFCLDYAKCWNTFSH